MSFSTESEFCMATVASQLELSGEGGVRFLVHHSTYLTSSSHLIWYLPGPLRHLKLQSCSNINLDNFENLCGLHVCHIMLYLFF